jgi:hypothetical protein
MPFPAPVTNATLPVRENVEDIVEVGANSFIGTPSWVVVYCGAALGKTKACGSFPENNSRSRCRA